MDMTVPAHRAGTGPQPDPFAHAAREAVDDLFRDGGYPTTLTPVGGILLVWDPNSSTAYLINPATRTRTTLRLRGVPRAQYVTLAW